MKKTAGALSSAAIAVLILCVAVSACACDETASTFGRCLQQYAAAGSQGETSLPDPVKAIVVTCDNQLELNGDNPPNWRIGSAEYGKLPEEMRAKTPDEVNTVIRINKMYEKVGVYVSESGGSTNTEAFAIRAYVTVVNLQTGVIWVKDRLFAGDPPRKIPDLGQYHSAELAQVPMERVVRMLKDGK